MEKIIKLFKKPFLHRSDDERDSQFEFLRGQPFLRRFLPEPALDQSLFIKLCLIGFSYLCFPSCQILYSSADSQDIFFIVNGKAQALTLNNLDFSPPLMDSLRNGKGVNEQILKEFGVKARILEKNESFGAFHRDSESRNQRILVISCSHIELFSLHRILYNELFLQIPGEKKRFLAKIFSDLPDQELLALNFVLREKFFEYKSYIYTEKNPNQKKIYVIKSGTARIFTNFHHKNQRKTVCLSEIGAGELIGIESFNEREFNNQRYSVMTSSIDGLFLLELDLTEFEYLMNNLPIFTQTLKTLSNLKSSWLSTRISHIEKVIFQRKPLVLSKKSSLSPSDTTKKMKKDDNLAEKEVLAVTFIKKVLEKHFKAFDIIENQKKKAEMPDLTANKTLTKIVQNNRNEAKRNLENMSSEGKIRILPNIFEKFDHFLRSQGRKPKTMEEYKAEVQAEIQAKTWNFDVPVEKKGSLSPLSRGPKAGRSRSPPALSKGVDVVRVLPAKFLLEAKISKGKRWKSPL